MDSIENYRNALEEEVLAVFYEKYDEEIHCLDDVIKKYPNIIHSIFLATLDDIGNAINCDFGNGNSFPWDKVLVSVQFFKIHDVYMEILQLADDRSNQRAYQRSGRSHWQGGGFGIKGAIKGAAMAGMMNVGTNLVRGIGDSVVNSNDKNWIEAKKKEVYNSVDMCEFLGYDVLASFSNIFDYIFYK